MSLDERNYMEVECCKNCVFFKVKHFADGTNTKRCCFEVQEYNVRKHYICDKHKSIYSGEGI